METTDQASKLGTGNTSIPGELTPQQALGILVQVANFAQSKGILNLDDAELVSKAVKTFVKKEEKTDLAPTATPEVADTTPVETAN